MHSERLKDLQKGMDIIAQVKQDAEWKGLDHVCEQYARFYEFGSQHLEPIQRFGRHPTRNKALGRKSTKAEEEYLVSVNARGQGVTYQNI